MKPKFFDLARKLAQKSDYEKYRLGCCIVKKNRVISLGFNKIKTHPKATSKYKYLHAEISALLGNTQEELKNCEVYIYRINKKGEKRLAKPCYFCELALKEMGIRRVHYTTDEGFSEEKY